MCENMPCLPTRLALIADSHLGQPEGRMALVRRLLGRHDSTHAERMTNVADKLLAHPDYADMVVCHLGDVTDRSTKKEWDEAREYLQDLCDHVVIGNHDATSVWGQGNGYSSEGHMRSLRGIKDLTGRRVSYPEVCDYGDWRLILLDSTAHNEKGTSFAQGRIGNPQLAFLAVELSVVKPTIVALHHSPMGGKPFLHITDSEAFLSVTNRDHVACVFGHLHEHRVFEATDNHCHMIALDAIYKPHVDPLVIDPVALLS